MDDAVRNVCLARWCRGFAHSTNILGAGSFEDVLRPINVFALVGVNCDEIIAFSELLVIALCLDFGNPEPDQSANDTAGCGSHSRAAERRHDWTGGNERTDAGNSQCANACQ